MSGLPSDGSVRLLERIQIDDVVLAIPVHCGCGIWGVIACGIFATQVRLLLLKFIAELFSLTLSVHNVIVSSDECKMAGQLRPGLLHAVMRVHPP